MARWFRRTRSDGLRLFFLFAVISRCSKLFYYIKVSRSYICRTLSWPSFPSVYQSLCPHSSIKQKNNLPQDRECQI